MSCTLERKFDPKSKSAAAAKCQRSPSLVVGEREGSKVIESDTSGNKGTDKTQISITTTTTTTTTVNNPTTTTATTALARGGNTEATVTAAENEKQNVLKNSTSSAPPAPFFSSSLAPLDVLVDIPGDLAFADLLENALLQLGLAETDVSKAQGKLNACMHAYGQNELNN